MYAALSGGRMGAIAEAQRGRVEFHGDFELSQRLLPALSVTRDRRRSDGGKPADADVGNTASTARTHGHDHGIGTGVP